MWTRRASALLAGFLIFYLIGLANDLFSAYFLAAGTLAWLAISWLLALRSGRQLTLSRSVASAHVYAGEPVQVTLGVAVAGTHQVLDLAEQVRNLTLDTTRQLRWFCETAGQDRTLTDQLIFDQRGHHRFEGLSAELGDPLGLFRKCLRPPGTFDLVVYPKPFRLPHFPLYGMTALGLSDTRIDRQAGEAGDFYGVRPYQQGDELRHIHWKSTAHSGKLAIKQYQRRSTSATVLYLDGQQQAHAQTPAGSTLEQCVQAAADLAAHVIAQGSPLRLLRAGRKIVVIPSDRGERQLLKVLEALALARADGEATLAQVIEGDRGAQVEGGTAVVVTPAADRELTRVLLALRSRGAHLVVVMVPPHLYGAAGDPEAAQAAFGTLATAGAAVCQLGPGQGMASTMRAGALW